MALAFLHNFLLLDFQRDVQSDRYSLAHHRFPNLPIVQLGLLPFPELLAQPEYSSPNVQIAYPYLLRLGQGAAKLGSLPEKFRNQVSALRKIAGKALLKIGLGLSNQDLLLAAASCSKTLFLVRILRTVSVG